MGRLRRFRMFFLVVVCLLFGVMSSMVAFAENASANVTDVPVVTVLSVERQVWFERVWDAFAVLGSSRSFAPLRFMRADAREVRLPVWFVLAVVVLFVWALVSVVVKVAHVGFRQHPFFFVLAYLVSGIITAGVFVWLV